MKRKKTRGVWAVSEAKSHFLELIRANERGQSFDIMKSGRVVAHLLPAGQNASPLPITGFAPADFVVSDLMAPLPETWSLE